MEDGTTVLFGLPDVVVDRVEVADDGVRTVHVVTAGPAAAAYPVCGVFATSVRQRCTTRPKDLHDGEAPLVVRWHQAQYRCRGGRRSPRRSPSCRGSADFEHPTSGPLTAPPCIVQRDA